MPPDKRNAHCSVRGCVFGIAEKMFAVTMARGKREYAVSGRGDSAHLKILRDSFGKSERCLLSRPCFALIGRTAERDKQTGGGLFPVVGRSWVIGDCVFFGSAARCFHGLRLKAKDAENNIFRLA